MEKIENILLGISKSLKKLTQIQQERLNLEKKVVKESKDGMKEVIKIRDMMLDKNDQFQSGINDMLGIKEKINLDSLSEVK